MSSCGDGIYWRAGRTERLLLTFRDKETQDPESLAGLSARMQFRASPESPTVLLELTDGNGITIEPGGATGKVAIVATPAQTRLLASNNRRVDLVFGLELFASPTEVPYSVARAIVVLPEVVREP